MDVLLNWLWQGCAAAGVAWVVLNGSRRLSATTRYSLWWTTMISVMSLPMLPALASSTLVAGDEAVLGLTSVQSVTLPPLPSWHTTLFLLCWAVWINVTLVRAVNALGSLLGIKQRALPFPTQREARLRGWMAVRARGRRAGLMVSNEIPRAAVLGLGSPVIAVTPSLLRELDDEELDRIIVHEWAHVQRRDDTARLIQMCVRVLVGFHPAVWWIDRQLEIEREVACDDRVVEITGAAKAYAASLTKLATMPCASPNLALAPGAFSASPLTTRVLRLLDGRRNRSTERSFLALTLATPALLTVAIGMASFELVVIATPPSARSAALVTATFTNVRHSEPPRAGQQITLQVRAREPKRVTATGTPMIPPDTRAAAIGQPQHQPGGARPVLVSMAAAAQESERHPAIPELPVSNDSSPWPLTAAIEQPEPPVDVTVDTIPALDTKSSTPWGAAADAAAAVGRGSQKAAVRTAGFFTKLGKNIGGAF